MSRDLWALVLTLAGMVLATACAYAMRPAAGGFVAGIFLAALGVLVGLGNGPR